MPTHVCMLAAAVMLLFNGAATAHSWYPEECCHDKDCHPIPYQEIEKISDGWQWCEGYVNEFVPIVAKAHQDMDASCSLPRL
jgi:hypothetical protein